MDFFDKNIQYIKSIGFKSLNFSGYGGTGYKKGNIEIWWGEWSYATIDVKQEDGYSFGLCSMIEDIKPSLNDAIKFIDIKLMDSIGCPVCGCKKKTMGELDDLKKVLRCCECNTKYGNKKLDEYKI